MKTGISAKLIAASRSERGFALVVSITLLVLLSVIGLGMLGLSAVTLRSSVQDAAMTEARANARLALTIALGELQKEMGPDMRVSAESAIFDENHESSTIEGVAQSRWTASYDSWGAWLNADYANPRTGTTLSIQDTYQPRRESMFRRWLLSLPTKPDGTELAVDPEAPDSIDSWNDDNSVILLGEGSLGEDALSDQITRAWLIPTGDTGAFAWWIGPENHKARIDKATNPRNLTTDEWQTAQGDTAEVGIGGLPGFDDLDSNDEVGSKLITTSSLSLAGVEGVTVKKHFLDMTSHSKGVLSSVRSGHLKKDLSLLFEKDSANLPASYRFNEGTDTREPSIRPMSSEIDGRAQVNDRHFQSWTNMRHYYRMYRQSSDATVKPYGNSSQTSSGGGINGPGNLTWKNGVPQTDMVSTANICDRDLYGRWTGSNNYWRVPVLAKITFLFSLRTTIRTNGPPARYDHDLLYTPIFTYWNPYNVRLRIPDQQLLLSTSAYPTFPLGRELFTNNTFVNEGGINPSTGINYGTSYLRSSDGGDIIFEPGEFRVFSYSSAINNMAPPLNLYPGFDPQAINGDYIRIVNNQLSTYNPGVALRFWNSEWGGNINCGNTAGSLNVLHYWSPTDPRNQTPTLPLSYQNDWFNVSQQREYITPNPRGMPGPGAIIRWGYGDSNPVPVAYVQLVLKGKSQANYESVSWAQDWRGRNWLYSPPQYFGHGLYASEDPATLHTQRLEHPYVMNFGPASMSELPKIVFHQGPKAFLGSGSNPFEKVTSVPALELPTAPISSLAGFAGMRINPGWFNIRTHMPHLRMQTIGGDPQFVRSFYGSENKAVAYQSGVTGPGIGNSFVHPLIPRDDVYAFFNNSISMDPYRRQTDWPNPTPNDTKAYCDHWDHVFLLNDALWDDYFVSSLADQTRPGADAAVNLAQNLDRLTDGEEISNSRYLYDSARMEKAEVIQELEAEDGYLKAARHLVVDGMFNVNSTSVAAWYSLFAGIRERKLVYRNAAGNLVPVEIPAGKRIAISRFDTAVSDQECVDPEFGASMPDGSPGWTGVRFLDDGQLMQLAVECVKQVKQRGPFLNFSEFINRRLSDDELGTMGALQSAIDYDDDSPQDGSINYAFKNGPDFMMDESDLGPQSGHEFKTPEAVNGSRFAGIPGYVIQSDILKPIANTLSVRDDTFRIRSYGEARDPAGKVIARAWCEAIVQREAGYVDSANEAWIAAKKLNAQNQFEDNPELNAVNRKFGRQFKIASFRWLNPDEV